VPAAKIKAELALSRSRLPACEVLFLIIERYLDNCCASCGRPQGDIHETKVAIKAAQVVLDRTGMGPRSVIELTKQSDGDLDLTQLTTEERGELLAAIAQINGVKSQLRARLLATPVSFVM
jgi:hypothetical protein